MIHIVKLSLIAITAPYTTRIYLTRAVSTNLVTSEYYTIHLLSFYLQLIIILRYILISLR